MKARKEKRSTEPFSQKTTFRRVKMKAADLKWDDIDYATSVREDCIAS